MPRHSAKRARPGALKRAGFLYRLLQVFGERILPFDSLTRDGMFEGDPPRMKKGASQAQFCCLLSSPAVRPIAKDGMSYRGEMDADLMRTTGSGAGFDE